MPIISNKRLLFSIAALLSAIVGMVLLVYVSIMPPAVKGLWIVFLIISVGLLQAGRKQIRFETGRPTGQEISPIAIKKARRMRLAGQVMITLAIFGSYVGFINKITGTASMIMWAVIGLILVFSIFILRRSRHLAKGGTSSLRL